MEKIYISDLDGTLLNSEAQLSMEVKDEINSMIEKGIKFTIATARSSYSIKEIFEGVNLDLPVIEFNGSFVTNIKTGEKLIVNNIEDDTARGTLDLILKFGQTPLISSVNGNKEVLYYGKSVSEGMNKYINARKDFKDKRLKPVDNMRSIINEKIVCLTLIDKKEKLDDLINQISEKYGEKLNIFYNEDLYYTGWYWASIYSSNAKKSNGIVELMNLLDIQNSHITVFGDHHNDIDMFKIANTAVAVCNAQEDLKVHADKIIGSNIDNSVIKYIKNDFN